MATNVGDVPETVKLRRTRVCGPQSKSGCLTCKSRKIKCDETRPTCLRCARSDRICEGYPVRVRVWCETGNKPIHIEPQTQTQHQLALRPFVNNPGLAVSDAYRHSKHQYRLAKLGCDVLAQDALTHFGESGAILELLVPQLSHSVPLVNAAAAALGSAYAVQLSDARHTRLNASLSAQQYVHALKEMRKALAERTGSSIPLLIACMMLAFAEVIRHQPDTALTHLLGAYKLLEERYRDCWSTQLCVAQSRTMEATTKLEEDLIATFRSLDLQVVMFALPRPPDLPIAIGLVEIPNEPFEALTAHRHIVPIIHAAYHFAASACNFKFCVQLAPREVLIEQGRQIGRVSQALNKLVDDVISPLEAKAGSAISPVHASALIIRCTCLAALIVLSTILSPYETAYDTQACHFEQIIEDAAKVVEHRQFRSSPLPIPNGPRFTPGPGVLYPLVLTALKYRNATRRRDALKLIQKSGREGPFYGPRTGKVVEHGIEVEEAGDRWHPPHSSSDNPQLTVNAADIARSMRQLDLMAAPEEARTMPGNNHIPERSRIVLFAMQRTATELPEKDLLTTTFGRCKDMDAMVAAAGVFIGEDIKKVGSSNQTLDIEGLPARFTKWWDTWTTTFEFEIGVEKLQAEARPNADRQSRQTLDLLGGFLDRRPAAVFA